MTIAQPTSGPEAARVGASMQWTVVQSGLWVGKIGGEFAGMIERQDAGFVAIRFAKQLGVFESLADAKRAFAG